MMTHILPITDPTRGEFQQSNGQAFENPPSLDATSCSIPALAPVGCQAHATGAGLCVTPCNTLSNSCPHSEGDHRGTCDRSNHNPSRPQTLLGAVEDPSQEGLKSQ